MDTKGYYKTLGVAENATADEIKTAYRKLALKWHPDRWVNGTDEEKKKAEEEFKKIAEAYDTLGDENKRQAYDSGVGGDEFGPDDDGFDSMSDWLRKAGFGNFGGFGGFGPQQRSTQNAPRRGEDIEAYITITFAESIKGVKKKITVNKKSPCPDCNGTGNADGKKHPCPHCHGTGVVTQTTRNGNMWQMYQSPCPHCHGTGNEVTDRCKKCGGTGFVSHEETVAVDIPAGDLNGMTIGYQGMGCEGINGGPAGTLLVHINVIQDQPGYFTKEGLNVVHVEKINFVDALLGTKFAVKTPEGKEWTVKLHECTQPGEEYKMASAGYTDVNNQWNKGDYVVRIKYDVPSSLTKEQKELLKNFNK